MYLRPLQASNLIVRADIDLIFSTIESIHTIHQNLLADLLATEKLNSTGKALIQKRREKREVRKGINLFF
jgi:hypothetical protein